MEETMIMDEQQPVGSEKKKADKNNTWKQVVIGGVSGIALGSVATTAVAATTSQPAEEGEAEGETLNGVNGSAHVDSSVPVAQVSDDMGFGEAFASAHNQVGPGGVFVWHGEVYNTYTAEEWNSMTSAEHAEFGSRVNVVYNEVANEPQPTSGAGQPSESEPDVTVVEPDVEILGVEVVHTEYGDMTLGGITVNGEDYVLVDVDGGDFDVAWHDDNHDQQIQETELTDISGDHISVNGFAQAADYDNNDYTNPNEYLIAENDMNSI